MLLSAGFRRERAKCEQARNQGWGVQGRAKLPYRKFFATPRKTLRQLSENSSPLLVTQAGYPGVPSWLPWCPKLVTGLSVKLCAVKRDVACREAWKARDLKQNQKQTHWFDWFWKSHSSFWVDCRVLREGNRSWRFSNFGQLWCIGWKFVCGISDRKLWKEQEKSDVTWDKSLCSIAKRCLLYTWWTIALLSHYLCNGAVFHEMQVFYCFFEIGMTSNWTWHDPGSERSVWVLGY